MVNADWLQAQLGRTHLPALGSSLSTTLGSTGLNDLFSLAFVSMVVFEWGLACKAGLSQSTEGQDTKSGCVRCFMKLSHLNAL